MEEVVDEQSKPPHEGLPADYPILIGEDEIDDYENKRRMKAKKAQPLFEKCRTVEIEEEEDEDEPQEGQGLHRSLPVLMDPDDELTLDNIEDMVNKAPWKKNPRSSEKEDLEKIEEIVQEFTNMRYPDFKERETSKERKISIRPRKRATSTLNYKQLWRIMSHESATLRSSPRRIFLDYESSGCNRARTS